MKRIVPDHRPGAAPSTMSSREIAALTEKRHPDVKRDIEKMLAELAEDVSKFARIYSDSMNRQQIEYHLDRELTDTLLTGYSAILRRRVVARWRELEVLAGDPVRLALVTYTEKVQILESRVEQLALKAEVHDRIAGFCDGSFCLTDAAKLLKVQPKKFFAELQAIDWIHRRPSGGDWLAYQARIKKGLLEHKVFRGFKPDGLEWIRSQVRVTPKGMTKLAAIFGAQGLQP